MSTTVPPTPDPVEDRLRATLAAEADRHPVTPDFEGLRARADRTVIDLTLPPRRNRARIVAAAAVVALLAGAIGGAVALQGDDDGEPIIADEPPATGYYLPGDGWEVQEIFAVPMPSLPGTARIVELGEDPADLPPAEDEVTDGRSATVYVTHLEGADPDLAAVAEQIGLSEARTVSRGAGDAAREYVIAPLSDVWGDDSEGEAVLPGSIETEGGALLAVFEDRLLSVEFYGPIGEQAVVAMADRWWESGGEAVVVDPATGMARLSDVTYADVEPTSVDDLHTIAGLDDSVDIAELYAGAVLQVVVQVESPDGWTGSYNLSPPGRITATGAHDPEAGTAAGLGPDELGAALPPDVGGPQPAWETGNSITADVPGAILGVNSTLFLTDPLTPAHARELWAALRPVSLDAWAAANDATDDQYVPDDTWGETLAETPVPPFLDDLWVEDEESSSAGAGEVVEVYEPVELLPRDGTNPAAGRTTEEVDRLVADAVLAFGGGPGPVDADLFAPTVAFDWDDGSDPVDARIEEVAGTTSADDGFSPALGARDVLAAATPADMTELVGPDGGCGTATDVAAEPDVVVLLQDWSAEIDEEPCTDWSALVVFLDDQQRITRVEVRSAV